MMTSDTKTRQGNTKNENYRSMLLKNIGAKILNKILVTNAKHRKAHIPLSSWVYYRDARIL